MAKSLPKLAQRVPTRAAKGKGRAVSNKPKDEMQEYGEMLREARREEPQAFAPSGRPAKRRRVEVKSEAPDQAISSSKLQRQTTKPVIDLDEEDTTEKEVYPRRRKRKRRDPTPEAEVVASDVNESEEENWEEVDLAQQNGDISAITGPDSPAAGPTNLDIVLDDPNQGRRMLGPKKRGITAEDRKQRLVVHKIHLLCLLSHIHTRSSWCNNSAVKAALQQLLTPEIKRLLHPSSKHPQPRRVKAFLDGLKLAKNLWQTRWTITARGLSKAIWTDDAEELENWQPPVDTDGMVDLEDFFASARSLSGSRDLGAQLFCAFFRAAGVSARLVSSLQPLPWTFKDAKVKAPTRPPPEEVLHSDEEAQQDPSDDEAVDITKFDDPPAKPQPAGATPIPTPRQRANRPATSIENDSPSTVSASVPLRPRTGKKMTLVESGYPVYWVEVFSVPAQCWIPVDALVTETVAKRLAFEPPASDPLNEMAYVVAFESDGHCRDVTRRYAKLYNAKTLKSRIEATEDGRWFWHKAMSKFSKGHRLDRDQIEDMELARWEAQEPMPSSVNDFKDHPQYALERQLKRSEALHPKEACGKVAIGKAGPDGKRQLEPVYRRRNVKAVKSADTWFRLGRVVRDGQEPLKVLKPIKLSRKQQERLPEGEEGTHGRPTPLFAEFQTELYRSPPVVQGQIPRNAYGNIDIYAPTMVPPGGVYVTAPDAVSAAKALGIDYAEAVVGFEFRGRSGFPILKGCVVAEQFQAALYQAIESIRVDRQEDDVLARTLKALQTWKKFVIALKVKQKVAGLEIEGERDEQERLAGAAAAVDQDQERLEGAGGFFHEGEGVDPADEDMGGGFLPDDGGAGGFIPEDDEGAGGGFLPEADDTADAGSLPDAPSERAGNPLQAERSPRRRRRRRASSATLGPQDPSYTTTTTTSTSPPAPNAALFTSTILAGLQEQQQSQRRRPSALAATLRLRAPTRRPSSDTSELSSVASSQDLEEQAQILAAIEASKLEQGRRGGEDVARLAVEGGERRGRMEEEEGLETGSRASHDPEEDLMDADWAL